MRLTCTELAGEAEGFYGLRDLYGPNDFISDQVCTRLSLMKISEQGQTSKDGPCSKRVLAATTA